MYPVGKEESGCGGEGESSSFRSQEAESQSAEHMGKSAAHPEDFGRSASFKLQIPSTQISSSSQYSGTQCKSAGLLKAKLPFGSLQRPNLNSKILVDDGERKSLLNLETASSSDARTGDENAALANSIAARAWKRCVSLPVEPASVISQPSASSGETTGTKSQHHASQRLDTSTKVTRSLSVPTRNVVIVRSGSFDSSQKRVPTNSEDGQTSPTRISGNDVEIPEEEAVCRICLSELTEGRSWLKIECSCKGDLRLTHEECVVKWFSIKGNKNCDVCGQEVLNLPVTLFRVQSSVHRDNMHQHTRQNSTLLLTRAWQDVVVLVLISTMCYFFFIEQLLVTDMKAHAIILAAPASFTLAILSSVFAILLARREYVWAYSAFQFSLVCVLLHLLYSTLKLRAIYAVLFSAVAGLGLVVGINSVCLQVFAWRTTVVRAQMNSNLA